MYSNRFPAFSGRHLTCLLLALCGQLALDCHVDLAIWRKAKAKAKAKPHPTFKKKTKNQTSKPKSKPQPAHRHHLPTLTHKTHGAKRLDNNPPPPTIITITITTLHTDTHRHTPKAALKAVAALKSV